MSGDPVQIGHTQSEWWKRVASFSDPGKTEVARREGRMLFLGVLIGIRGLRINSRRPRLFSMLGIRQRIMSRLHGHE